MKKRTFILLELFIALALVALFSLPLVRGHFFYQNKQKERLLDLEKERKAEELFHQIYLELKNKHPLHSITAAWKKNPFCLKSDTVIFNLGTLGKTKLYWHYHLYSHVDKKKIVANSIVKFVSQKTARVKMTALQRESFLMQNMVLS